MTGGPVRRVAPPRDQALTRVRPPAAPSRRVTLSPAGAYLIERAPALLAAAAPLAASPADLQPADLATGRGLTYEWELFLADVLRRLALVESGTGGGGGGLSYVHTQNAPAATWTISHNLGTAPALELVADDGTELYAEVHHPDLNTVVIIFGQPWSGTAYLYG